MNRNIILCGVGGQGTILASRLIAAAALRRGLPIRTAETIGMAQRGGSVCSHLRIGEGAHSPLVPKGCADLIIAFEPGEAVRMLPYLKADGAVVCATRPVMPVSASIGRTKYDAKAMLDHLKSNVLNLTLVDVDKAAERLGTAKALNVVLLGAAVASDALGFDVAEIEAAIREKVPAKFLELNLKALRICGTTRNHTTSGFFSTASDTTSTSTQRCAKRSLAPLRRRMAPRL